MVVAFRYPTYSSVLTGGEEKRRTTCPRPPTLDGIERFQDIKKKRRKSDKDKQKWRNKNQIIEAEYTHTHTRHADTRAQEKGKIRKKKFRFDGARFGATNTSTSSILCRFFLFHSGLILWLFFPSFLFSFIFTFSFVDSWASFIMHVTILFCRFFFIFVDFRASFPRNN